MKSEGKIKTQWIKTQKNKVKEMVKSKKKKYDHLEIQTYRGKEC